MPMDEEVLILVVLALLTGLGVVTIVLPIIAIVRTRAIGDLEHRLSRLEQELHRLGHALASTAARPEQVQPRAAPEAEAPAAARPEEIPQEAAPDLSYWAERLSPAVPHAAPIPQVSLATLR